ncbi:MAG TPA: hypothetical protein VL742_18480 [Casimicrobiaceae bacterium]|nr:hypothetical protein [Casimicrobiaceae bacterium]
MRHEFHQRLPYPKDLGRRAHELVHRRPPHHGSNPPLCAPHLRALLELLEVEGHDVAEFRDELAQLLRALMRARHFAGRLDNTRLKR